MLSAVVNFSAWAGGQVWAREVFGRMKNGGFSLRVIARIASVAVVHGVSTNEYALSKDIVDNYARTICPTVYTQTLYSDMVNGVVKQDDRECSSNKRNK